MIVKLIGGAMLVASGALGAEALNTRGQRRLQQIEGWAVLVRYARRMVECYALPETEILARVSRETFAACGYDSAKRPTDFRTVLSASRVEEMSTEALHALQRFVNTYGQGFRTEQTQICEECLFSLIEERDRLLGELRVGRKRNTTVAVSAAMGIAILLF